VKHCLIIISYCGVQIRELLQIKMNALAIVTILHCCRNEPKRQDFLSVFSFLFPFTKYHKHEQTLAALHLLKKPVTCIMLITVHLFFT